MRICQQLIGRSSGTDRIPLMGSSQPLEPTVLQLDESSYGFLVFRNSSNDRVNVIYRRQDKNLGLITPEF